MNEETKKKLELPVKRIKNWIIHLVALYVGFIVLTQFLHVSAPTGGFMISAAIAVPIFALLFWNIIILLQIKKKLKESNESQGT